jgi:hypothetical protein
MADRLFSRFDLGEYVGLVTAELPKRPIPQAFLTAETAPLTDLVSTWLPHIYNRVMQELEPPSQAINKVSRLGDPEFRIPTNKMDVVKRYYAMFAAGELSTRRRIIEIYVRLQTEPSNKTRNYMFIDDYGRVYTQDIGQTERTIEIDKVGRRVCSRTRPIFNMPLENIWKQALDSAIHNVFLKYPAFHHDMFGRRVLPITPGDFHICTDVKHFERHTADSVYASGQILGGQYGAITELFRQASYIVPSDTRKTSFLLQPNFKAGYSLQFASGDSRVAPVQKEIFTALIGEFVRVTRHVSYAEAINFVFNGGDAELTMRNYGDDNSYSGRKDTVLALVRFLQEYLTVEEERPPKFLGFIWDGEWKLSLLSYLSKTHYNERAPYSNFRKYPNLGWVLKRQTYAEYGDRRIAEEVYPYEDIELQRANTSWVDINWRAERERERSRSSPGHLDINWILGRDYALTTQEKITTGEYFGFTPTETAPIIKHLLGPQWRRLLKWN